MAIRKSPLLLVVALASIIPLPGLSPGVGAQAPDSRLFPETGHTVQGRFLQYWQSHGGLMQQGYPISEQMQEKSDTDGKTYTVQYFERAVFEFHSENAAPYDVLLSLLGDFLYKEKYPQGAPGQAANSSLGSVLFPQTGHKVGGKFLEYWRSHGGLAQQGYPISDEFQETSPLDGKQYRVQYFERAVFEWHSEKAGTPYEVLLSQLGRFRYDSLHKDLPSPTPSATVMPSTPAATSTPDSAVVSWLRQHVIPFNTEQPGSAYADLMPVKQMVGNARIVSLGEATHGTREFFLMKHRMLEFLVDEMGFTTFAIEANWPEANLVNDYVLTGQGDPAKLLQGLYFWTWNTQEVLDMIKWMRAHNEQADARHKVSFTGFDMQYPTMALDNVTAYVGNVDPPQLEQITSLLSCFHAYARSPDLYSTLPENIKSRCRADLQQVYDFLKGRKAQYEEASSPQEFSIALQSARVAQQGEDYYSTYDPTLGKRDRFMAENAEWLLDQAGPTGKMVIWAHNGHIGTWQEANGVRSMGTYLRERYGKAMATFGFAFYGGSFNAVNANNIRSLGAVTAGPPPDNSYEYLFNALGKPRFFLDMRGVQQGTVPTDWLLGPHLKREVGAVYDSNKPDDYFNLWSLPTVFDVAIYIKDSSPSTLLPFSP